ncbi:ParB N-terminal domain-containing protein [Labilibaculum euxinus]|uniref:ParB-like N-terminal domain-containing protein n=1 Tax=Labilibaculum euxinus TaxID=2686357 RepID=A0A7M4D2D4_9BACT|nr:ParB N-terminal domain-containing protein [Labilibaculum euxinus]MUP36813.1 hypothetical protein [Labilibaculum euxinus]MVB06018.1 hypothetical protein [Labilibaculum euxinus]
MSEKFDWLLKKTPRSVDQIRLWPENPRLNPDETHTSLSDFADDLTYDTADKKDFYELITSISEDGFIPADPVVVWKNEENSKYYVAEGNRRLVALKLLREPHKSPKSIRRFVRKASDRTNLTEIEKIPVNVAPTFEEAEWYINQRNSSSSLQRKWTRVQQQRWIITLYEKHNGNIDKIMSITKLSKSELEGFFRILKIKDFVKLDEVRTKLTDDEFDKANSYRFPITILERFFSFSDVKDRWGVEYDNLEVKIISVKSSFLNAFAELIKRIVNNKEDDKINTRLTKDDLAEILDSLPQVVFPSDNGQTNEAGAHDNEGDRHPHSGKNNEGVSEATEGSQKSNSTNTDSANNQSDTIQYLKGNPKRPKMVLSIYELKTDSYRLQGLFSEFKKISLGHKNCVAAGLRVFLDLAVLNYIQTEGIENSIRAQYQDDLRNVPLKKRLEYIKSNHLNNREQIIVNRLIDSNYHYSLDVLNGYIHGQETHNLNKEFLNSFWDFLFPLFEALLDIKEN